MCVKIIIKEKFEGEGEQGKKLRGEGEVEVIFIEYLHAKFLNIFYLIKV